MQAVCLSHYFWRAAKITRDEVIIVFPAPKKNTTHPKKPTTNPLLCQGIALCKGILLLGIFACPAPSSSHLLQPLPASGGNFGTRPALRSPLCSRFQFGSCPQPGPRPHGMQPALTCRGYSRFPSLRAVHVARPSQNTPPGPGCFTRRIPQALVSREPSPSGPRAPWLSALTFQAEKTPSQPPLSVLVLGQSSTSCLNHLCVFLAAAFSEHGRLPCLGTARLRLAPQQAQYAQPQAWGSVLVPQQPPSALGRSQIRGCRRSPVPPCPQPAPNT